MKRTLIPLLLALLLAGCSAATTVEPVTGAVFAMDTVMDLTIYGSQASLDSAEARIQDLEAQLSVTDESSEIYALNQNGSGTLSGDAAALLSQALALCEETGGALDLSIYPVVRAWGFTTGAYSVPADETLQALLTCVDYAEINLDSATGRVTLAPGMEIDLGSVAKGYTGDQVLSLLREDGVIAALLNLGGNVQALGSKPDGSPWKIAVQNPFGSGYVGTLEIVDQAVITSGGYERYFEENGQVYWHIIDPATGTPARNGLVSVTVVGSSGLLCDGLSTALFVMGPERAAGFWREHGGFEAILVTEDRQILVTEGLEDNFQPLNQSAGWGKVQVIRHD